MSTATKVRFLAKTASGAVHAVGAGAECPVVKKGAREGTWKGMRSIPPAKVLGMKDCARCDTHARAEAALNGSSYGAKPAEPEPKKTSKVATGRRGRPNTGGGSDKHKGVAKERAKERSVRMTQAGPRSTGGDSEDKANQLLEFAQSHGWKGKVALVGQNQATVTVSKKDEGTITCNFVDGKYDVGNQATLTMGDWTGVLRGAHRVRKQMSLEVGDRPLKPGSRKRSPKAEADHEDQDDTERVVPWSADAKDDEIIAAVRGKVIEWRNKTSNAIDRAEVAERGGNVEIKVHPRKLDRLLTFAQVVYDDKGRAALGGERVVRLARIINVRPS